MHISPLWKLCHQLKCCLTKFLDKLKLRSLQIETWNGKNWSVAVETKCRSIKALQQASLSPSLIFFDCRKSTWTERFHRCSLQRRREKRYLLDSKVSSHLLCWASQHIPFRLSNDSLQIQSCQFIVSIVIKFTCFLTTFLPMTMKLQLISFDGWLCH